MNDREIAGVVEELRARWVGRAVGNVWQPTRDRVVVGFTDGTLLLMVPRGPFARLHVARARPKNPDRPFSFQGACRAHLHGPLTAVDKDPGDRVVRLTFARGALELRLTGRSGGLWLLDGESIVAAYDGPAPAALPALPPREARNDVARFTPGPEGWNAAADRWFSAQETDRDRAEREQRVRVSLQRLIQRTERLRENLEDDLRRADRAPAIRKEADLLAGNLYRVGRGASAVTVEDWEGGGTVSIALDPARPPSATLERLYHQAKRLERVAERVLARLDGVEADQRRHRADLESLETLGADALEALERRLPRAPSGSRRAPSELPYTVWVGPGGLRVLVGRNARGNRRLTFQTAKGHDWWMHVRGRPGAHLVLPTPKDRSPSLEHLLAAAQIALAAAQLEPHEAADLQYTRVRDVRAVPGEDGLVTVSNEKVLHVARDPAALAGWFVAEAEG